MTAVRPDAASFRLDERGLYVCRPLERFDWLEHGFSTRHSAAWLDREPVASAKQIHSGIVRDAGAAGCLGEGDALVTNQPGLWVAVRTADCLPVLLVDAPHRAVAMVHAGWRGAVERIAARAVERMAESFGSRPEDISAAVGPGIASCCYEVGPEVAARFGREGRAKIDLPQEVARQLETAGLAAERIFLGSFCTFCQEDEFWSFRREGDAAGRMWSAARAKSL